MPCTDRCARRPASTGLNPRQLHVFDAPDRDDRGWVLSVAHCDVVPVDRLPLAERIARGPRR